MLWIADNLSDSRRKTHECRNSYVKDFGTFSQKSGGSKKSLYQR